MSLETVSKPRRQDQDHIPEYVLGSLLILGTQMKSSYRLQYTCGVCSTLMLIQLHLQY